MKDLHPLEGDDDPVNVKFLQTGRYGDPDPSKRVPLIRAREGDVFTVREAHARRLEKNGQVERVTDEPSETRDDGSDADLGQNPGAAASHKADLVPDPRGADPVVEPTGDADADDDEPQRASRTRRDVE